MIALLVEAKAAGRYQNFQLFQHDAKAKIDHRCQNTQLKMK